MVGSTEAEVDHFYNSFLHSIFTREKKFDIALQIPVAQDVNMKKADICIRVIKQGPPRRRLRVVLCESKRRGYETHSKVWEEALNQVVDYCKLVRHADRTSDQTMYLTVNVGTYVRFYELPPRTKAAIDWAPAGGRLYELADDEAKVWELFHQLRDQVMDR